jgi:CRISPR/Cas system-associated exonuclease Cas4 (RecB family)
MITAEEKLKLKEWNKNLPEEEWDFYMDLEESWRDASAEMSRTMITDLKDFDIDEESLREKITRIAGEIDHLSGILETKVYIRKKIFLRDMAEKKISPNTEKFQLTWDLIYAVTDNNLKNRLAELLDEHERVGKYLRLIGKVNHPEEHGKMLDIETARQFPISDIFPSEMKQKNGKLWGNCPFHGEKTPSFMVDSKNKFHCFSCGKHGDVIDFLMELEGVSFADAVRRLT